jgi:threonine/homoserine/homoserine lactone efflux protein
MWTTIATAKLSGLITTSLNLPHPILMAIAFCLHIIMDGHPLCSHYDTVLMLLHVIICLWFHPSILMMGRKSQEQLMVLNTFLRNHTTSMTK